VDRLKKITRPHLILCEGIDAKFFLIHYLRQTFGEAQEDFTVADFGGINELDRNSLKVLPNLPNFEKLESIVIIRDAENDGVSAKNSVENSLRSNGYASPAKPCEVKAPSKEQHHIAVAYALFPSFNLANESGTLEDLCLKIIADYDKDIILDIVEAATSAIEERNGFLKRKHKNELHTFLSLTDNFVGLKIGESAKAGAFDFDSPYFTPLKQLLESLRSTITST
jgi:hypothetical protein